jgi:hypothetical protein
MSLEVEAMYEVEKAYLKGFHVEYLRSQIPQQWTVVEQ